jgi:hypothetical protein
MSRKGTPQSNIDRSSRSNGQGPFPTLPDAPGGGAIPHDKDLAGDHLPDYSEHLTSFTLAQIKENDCTNTEIGCSPMIRARRFQATARCGTAAEVGSGDKLPSLISSTTP